MEFADNNFGSDGTVESCSDKVQLSLLLRTPLVVLVIDFLLIIAKITDFTLTYVYYLYVILRTQK